MNSQKLLIAISHSETHPWNEMYKLGQFETWIKINSPNVDVIRYSSQSPNLFWKIYDEIHEKFRFSSRIGKWQGRIDRFLFPIMLSKRSDFYYSEESKVLEVCAPSTYIHFHKRNRALFEWFLSETKYDFLFRTNSSSYIVQEKLFEAACAGHSPLFSGKIHGRAGSQFVSGAGILLDRPMVSLILENWDLLELHMIEDVALSRLAKRLGVSLQSLDYLEVSSVEDLRRLSDDILQRYFHFRCKALSRPSGEIDVMNALNLRIQNIYS